VSEGFKGSRVKEIKAGSKVPRFQGVKGSREKRHKITAGPKVSRFQG
jgi:hypothetical protein